MGFGTRATNSPDVVRLIHAGSAKCPECAAPMGARAGVHGSVISAYCVPCRVLWYPQKLGSRGSRSRSRSFMGPYIKDAADPGTAWAVPPETLVATLTCGFCKRTGAFTRAIDGYQSDAWVCTCGADVSPEYDMSRKQTSFRFIRTTHGAVRFSTLD